MSDISLKCKCGGTFSMSCTSYIIVGGHTDSRGRKFISEVRADEWLDRHQGCITPAALAPQPETCDQSVNILRRVGLLVHAGELASLSIGALQVLVRRLTKSYCVPTLTQVELREQVLEAVTFAEQLEDAS